jgi:hypothetical protein
MNSKLAKIAIGGFSLYIVFAALVLTFYDDDPEQMSWDERQAFNKRYINKLTLSEPIKKLQIVDDLGPPDITEAKKLDSEVYQVMFYRTKHLKKDGITTKDECTPLLFKNGLLIAWGNTAFEQFSAVEL